MDNALNERGGLMEVRRRSSGHPTNFAIRLEFILRDGQTGYYSFNVGALAGRGYEVQTEKCVIGGKGKGPYFHVERGVLKDSSEPTFPAVTPDTEKPPTNRLFPHDLIWNWRTSAAGHAGNFAQNGIRTLVLHRHERPLRSKPPTTGSKVLNPLNFLEHPNQEKY